MIVAKSRGIPVQAAAQFGYVGATILWRDEGVIKGIKDLEGKSLAISPGQAQWFLMPAFCRFPARVAVLQQKLGFDPDRLDVKPCPRLDEYWERVQPEAVSLIFSAYYLNNPASMFGHTFLRVRKRGPAVDRQKRELLDSAIDYAASMR